MGETDYEVGTLNCDLCSRHEPVILGDELMTGAHHHSSVSAKIDETIRAVRAKTPLAPKVGVVLGSGLGAFADTLEDLVKIPYAELPHMARSAVVGHAGNLCLGKVGGVPVVCMQGRVHLYEGHSPESVVHGARTMARLGASCVLITNAAGGLEPTWEAGDLMIMSDHLNLTGHTPLLGPNDDALGPRFPDMSTAYDPELRAFAREVGAQEGVALREGVYAGLLGPSYETPAEVRMLRGLGAHAVGMSTVLETIALRHMRVRVGALSCITNLAAGISRTELNHAEVEETARRKKGDLLKLLGGWIKRAGALA
jgi:purine-nucleoside phosphorylase